MRKIVFPILLLCCVLYSCKKTAVSPVSIEGETAVCSESTTIKHIGAFPYDVYKPEELIELYPYTYMMHKYLDMALEFLEVPFRDYSYMEISEKQSKLMEAADQLYSLSSLENGDYGYTSEDDFFADLYMQLVEDVNSFPIVRHYMSESKAVVDTDDIVLPLDGGVAYSKLTILYCYENSMPLEVELYSDADYYEDNDCDCYSEAALAPRRLVRYILLSKWLTDIRYRNYKNSCPDMNAMRDAMDEWEAATDYAIRFKEIKDNGWNRFTWGIGCNYHVCISDNLTGDAGGVSSLGAVPWAYVHINPDYAEKGTCLHELGHTLALEHEQCRPDRDCYITIHYDNIKPSWKIQYHKFLSTSATAYGEFDFESIMLYDSYSNSAINSDLPVMTKKDGSTFRAQRECLSRGDIEHIRNIYY